MAQTAGSDQGVEVGGLVKGDSGKLESCHTFAALYFSLSLSGKKTTVSHLKPFTHGPLRVPLQDI